MITAESDAIFRKADIRGVYPNQINEEVAFRVGQAFVHYTKSKCIAIGRDKRVSSDSLFNALVKGITSMGCNIYDIGSCTSPLLYFSVGTMKLDGGIMITASHNPPEYNGFKIVKKNAIPFSSKEIMKLRNLAKKKKFRLAKKKGRVSKKSVLEKYLKKIVSYAKFQKKLKVVIDCGNGMAGFSARKIFSKLPVKATYLYEKIDQTYPNHPANPIKSENLKDLQKRVKKEKADLGIAFDGDVDRVGFVDEKGHMIPMDLMTAFIAQTILKEKPKSKIIYDLRSSRVVREKILESGGVPIEFRVGHSFIKRKMRKCDAVFSGELSGHYFFSDLFYSDNPMIASILVMNALDGEKLSTLVKDLKKYCKIEETDFKIMDVDGKMKELKKKYRGGKISYIDGIKIEFDDWWFNLRESNTEPLVRLNLEANTQKLLDSKFKEIKKILEN